MGFVWEIDFDVSREVWSQKNFHEALRGFSYGTLSYT